MVLKDMYIMTFKLIFTNSFVFQLPFHNWLKHRTAKPKKWTVLAKSSTKRRIWQILLSLLTQLRRIGLLQQIGTEVFEMQLSRVKLGLKNKMDFPGAVELSHPPTLGITVAAQVRSKIRTEAQMHPFIPGFQIVKSAIHEHLDPEAPCPSLPKSMSLFEQRTGIGNQVGQSIPHH